ncbi:hypothetical protein Hanom_Chr11g01054081 [Helianthus anomalus]
MGITFFENDISNHNQQLIKSGNLTKMKVQNINKRQQCKLFMLASSHTRTMPS